MLFVILHGKKSGCLDFNRQKNQLVTMTLENFPELKRLTSRARLKIAEELWDSAVSDRLSVPASHKSLVRSRRAAYNRGEMKTLSMPELKRSIRRQS